MKKEKDGKKERAKEYTAQEAYEMIERIVDHVDFARTGIIAIVWDREEDADGNNNLAAIGNGDMNWIFALVSLFKEKENEKGKYERLAAYIYGAQAIAARSLGARPLDILSKLTAATEEAGL